MQYIVWTFCAILCSFPPTHPLLHVCSAVVCFLCFLQAVLHFNSGCYVIGILLCFSFCFCFLYKGFFWPALGFLPSVEVFPLGRFFSPGSCGCLNKIVFFWSCTGLCCCCCCCLYYWRAHGYLLPIISEIVVACLHMV